MQRRRLGSSDIEVSVLGLGTVKFGRNQGVKYPESFVIPNDKQICDLLFLAKDLGINFLDTAPAYGTSEERLGKLLTNRNEWIISSKVGETFVDGKSFFDFSAQSVKKSVDASLSKLNTDYIDILLVHSNGEDNKLLADENLWRVLEECKQSGKVRTIGMSTKTIEGALLSVAEHDVTMLTYNKSYVAELAAIQKAADEQKGILVKKALASGHINQVGNVADALNFVLQEPGVSSIILGTINLEHLTEGAHAIR